MPAISARHFLLFICLTAILLTACNKGSPAISAPPGDHKALEKLADAWRQNSASLAMSPVKLSPKARRKFLGQVFATAGYDYSLTLSAFAAIDPKSVTQDHIDLKQLLFLPHHDSRLQDLSDIYSGQEIAAIDSINKILPGTRLPPSHP